MVSFTLSLQSALISSELLLPAQNVLICLKFLLTSAELCVTWEQSVFPVVRTCFMCLKGTYALEHPSH